MKTKDLYIETRFALTANPMRTFLTMLGIIIGIGSVIVMLAIGAGAQASIQSSISSLGSNVLTISSGGGGGRRGVSGGSGNGQSLKLADADAIKTKIPLVKEVAPYVQSRAQVIAGANNTNVSIIGVVPEYMSIKSIEMDSGIFITDSQNRNFAKVAVLGPTTRDTLFGVGENPVGQKIKIKSNTYTVIGVTVSKGGGGFGNSDDVIYIPLMTAMQYISGGNYVNAITITTPQTSDLTPVQASITTLLLDRHNITNKDLADFSIFNQADVASTASMITSTFTILIGSVAGISLLVGGIGIMNMMLTIVRERTREIGLRKAIGAERRDISNQFLVEAIVVTCLGGVIGILLGVGISLLITLSGVFTTQVTLNSILLSFTVSAIVGIAFGYYPAKKASELNPIDALRYE